MFYFDFVLNRHLYSNFDICMDKIAVQMSPYKCRHERFLAVIRTLLIEFTNYLKTKLYPILLSIVMKDTFLIQSYIKK